MLVGVEQNIRKQQKLYQNKLNNIKYIKYNNEQ